MNLAAEVAGHYIIAYPKTIIKLSTLPCLRASGIPFGSVVVETNENHFESSDIFVQYHAS